MEMLRYKPYSLELKEPFGTAHGTRTHTDGMLAALFRGPFTGYGEAFMPPYYQENQASMAAFFEKIDAAALLRFDSIEEANDYVFALSAGDTAAKAAIDIALHDLFGKELGISFPEHKSPIGALTSFTIGVDSIESMVRKARAAAGFTLLKIKLNGRNDVEAVTAIRGVTEQQIFVDANQAWTDPASAITTAELLVELGVGLIEQPFPKGEFAKSKILKVNCGVPVIADEDVQGLADIEKLSGSFDGINIKLMKCGGIRQARLMIAEAKRLGLKILLGCMTESSIGISAAAGLAHLADWCDLDGNLLIKNDTCTAVQTIKGELRLSDVPGIGITDDSKLRRLFGLDA